MNEKNQVKLHYSLVEPKSQHFPSFMQSDSWSKASKENVSLTQAQPDITKSSLLPATLSIYRVGTTIEI